MFLFPFLQAEEHPLHLQHHPGGSHLAGLHRPVPNGPQHLVLCGEPLFQIPLVLQSFLHHEIMNQGLGARLWVGGMKITVAVDDESSEQGLRWATGRAWSLQWLKILHIQLLSNLIDHYVKPRICDRPAAKKTLFFSFYTFCKAMHWTMLCSKALSLFVLPGF